MFLIALAAFVMTSALTGAAPNTQLLIAARLLQGVAGGMLIPQASGLVQELFRGPERGRAFGIIGGTVGLATAAGPVTGGLILAMVTGPESWRWVFFVNVPVGLVALALAVRFVPSLGGRGWRAVHLDVVGSLLLAGGVLTVLMPLVDAATGGLKGLWWMWGLAGLLLAAFARWEVRTANQGRQPLLDPRLARTPGYAAGSGIGLLYFVGFTGVWLVLALFLQDGLGYSALSSGLAVTPFALGIAASAVIAGRLVPRFGRWLTVFGLAAIAVGLFATALVLRQVTGDTVPWIIVAPLLLAGLGGGMVTSPNMTLTLQNVPVEIAGAAGGAVQTAQRIGGAIGTAALAMIFYSVLVGTGQNYPVAVSDAVLAASGFMVLALLMAVADLTRKRWHRASAAQRTEPAPVVGSYDGRTWAHSVSAG
jgi:MFS family permease